MKSTIFILGISLLIGIGLSVFYMQIITLVDTKSSYSRKDTIESYDESKAPPDALQGSITHMEGEVMWLSRVATEAAKLDRSASIQQGESIETGDDGEVTILFDEDTLVDIYSKSSVSFTQTLPANIVITHRGGEVEYSQETSTIPLSIRVGHLLVKLHEGTISVVFEESNVTVQVIEGSATAVYNDLEYETNYIELKEGQTIYYNNITRENDLL